jgi:hypothetical protein
MDLTVVNFRPSSIETSSASAALRKSSTRCLRRIPIDEEKHGADAIDKLSRLLYAQSLKLLGSDAQSC